MKGYNTSVIILACLLMPLLGFAQPDSCNIPMVGKGRVIDQLSGGTACLLCNSTDLDNIVDGDLSNFASYNTTVVLVATPIVSVKDVMQDYPAGKRAGFVIAPQGGLLSLDLLAGFQIRTYKDNVLQQTITTSNGLALTALGASGGKQRISFVTSQAFDEIELLQSTTLGALSSIRVYYAFTESATGCDYNCETKVVTGSPYAPSINNGLTGITGFCLLCDVSNEGNVINANTNDFGNIFLTLGLGVQGSIGINVGATIPAGYDAGFAIAQNGGGLVDLAVLSSTTIETYLNGTPRESIPFASLADVSVLGGSKQLLSFKTTMSFNRMRIRINSLLAVLVNVDVYYAFVRPDDDNDGFVNCVDKCAGQNDNLDADGDGKPDACDTQDCTLNAGLDISVCPPGTTAQLAAAGSGQTWSTVAGNPSAATINNSGLVSNMTVEGAYKFQLNGPNGCHDTLVITRQTSALAQACNNPITGFGVIPFDPSNGNCLLCLNANLALDGGLNTYVELDANLPIASGTPIIGVYDTLHDYPAGRRVGFVVEAVGGLVDLSLLSNFEIRTYLNGVLKETATTGNTLLAAGVLPGSGNRQRISFVTTQPFDAVVLVSNALLSTVDYFRVYYAFEEPTSCPDLATENCAAEWLVGSDYCSDIVEDHTGLTGLACVGCSITSIGNVIDDDNTNAATITLTIGVGAEASIAVKTIQTLNQLYEVGFIISGGNNLLDAGVLGNLQLRTYMNNTPVDNYYASNGLVDVTLLGNGSSKGLVSFRPTAPFNEIRLTVYGLVSALQSTLVYSAFARRDADSDNTPDCIDKCCSGSDDVDTDGDGSPDNCDNSNDPPLAINDFATTPEETAVTIAVLANDGDPNFNTISTTAAFDPPHGSVMLSGNNVVYTPDANFNGVDTFQYVVCDNLSACDTARVFVTVTAINDAPVANDDAVSTPEDTPVTLNVTANDTDVDGSINNSSLDLDPNTAGVQTTFTVAGQGTYTRDGAGNVTFTPVLNFNGTSTLQYRVCDNGVPAPALCDLATLTVTVTAVNDAPVALNDQGSAAENTPVTVNVLNNDSDVDGTLSPGSVQVLTAPGHGSTSVNSMTGAITYTPANGFNGYDTLSYVVCDNGTPVKCDTALVTFTINGPVSECNDPITGKTAVVDHTGTGLLCLLCGNSDIENLVDGDLSNFTTFNAPVTVLTATSVVSIKDIVTDYQAGIRVGYVLEPQGGLLNSSLLGSFQVRTYLNNSLQQTINGNTLNVQSIGTLRRLSFVSSQPFDEVELVLVSTLGALTSVRVYYAFVEPAAGCDYECVKAVVPPNYTSSINNGHTGLSGLLCLLCSVDNTGNVVNANTGDYGSINLLAGLGVSGSISVNAGEEIPAGYDPGFAISDGNGLLGLLGASVLGNTEILTYKNNTFQESIALNSALANVVLLNGSNNINLVSFKSTLPFDEIRIRVNSLLGLAINLRVHYAFVRPDDDSDGYANCVDKCAGFADYLDADGDGAPNGCDPVCMLNAGIDLSICPPETGAQLPAAGSGQTWTALSGNPAAASANAAGVVSGMTAEGVYGFVLSEGACTDTVYLSRFTATLDASCNNPITGNNVVVDQVGLTGGICLLCGGASGAAVIDGNLSNYASYTVGVGVLTATSIISIKDTAQVYPAGRRTGFVVEPVGGLLDAVALNTLQIRTYLNNVPREIAIVSNGLVTANVIGNGNLQRLSFVTTQSFDEIELVATSLLGAISTLRVYYGFEEPVTCSLSVGDACADALLATDNTFCGQISYNHTEITGICTGCSIDNLGNVIDQDQGNFAVINLSVGVGATGRIAVFTRQEIPAGYSAGFVVSTPSNLLDANVLAGLRLRTFLNGVQQETQVASNGLINLSVLNSASGLTELRFKTTLPFDEIQLQVDALVAALSTLNVHYGFARGDSDGDGAPDCADKCCGNNDNLDSNGNGVPDGCDGLPTAVDDANSTPEEILVNIPVVTNDDFGPDGPGQTAITITDVPNHGTAIVNNNGTPSNPADDFISYTPALNYNGFDTLFYRICDVDMDCDTARVIITVTPVNDPPSTPNTPANTPEDTPVDVCVNIMDVDNNTFTTTLLCSPDHGTVSNLGNPATTQVCLTYTPDLNYSGPDTLCVQVCDGAGACDTTYVIITVSPVNDPPVANDDTATTPEDSPVTLTVTSNDTDLDGAIDPTTVDLDPNTAGIQTIFVAAGGTFTYLGAGDVSFTPNTNFTGTTTAQYQVCDTGTPLPAMCDLATITVTVSPVNDAPVANDDTATTPEDTPTTVNITNNDTDTDGAIDPTTVDLDPNTAGIQTTFVAAGGTFTYLGGGDVSFAPNANFTGTTTTQYQVCDTGTPLPAMCDLATITVTVSPVNDAPVANDDTATTPEDTQTTVNITNNDTDLDGAIDPTTVDLDPNMAGIQTTFVAAGGTFTYLGAGDVSFTPNTNFTGTTTAQYQVCDTGTPLPAMCDLATITVTVSPVNDAPLANDDTATTPEDTPATVNITNNDTDTDGAIDPTTVDLDPNTAGIQTTFVAAGGTFTYLGGGDVSFTPNANFTGTTTAQYQVCDTGTPLPAMCDLAMITVTVSPVNDAPIAVNNVITTPEGVPVMIPVLNNDTDVDSPLDSGSLMLITPPDHGTATPNPATGTIDYVPDSNFFGNDTLTYQICDTGMPALCDTAMVVVTVSATKVRLDLTMRLQGSVYNSPDTLMRDDLRINNRIPKKEPYTALGPQFLHVNGGGGEMVTDSVTVFANYGANSIVDWVFIELRDSANPALVVATRAALLQRDGDVVDVDGVSLLTFSSSLPRAYSVAIRHRNHLGCMTAAPIALSATGTQIDFSNLATPLYDDGTNLNGLEQITINGKFALWAGNVNKNKTVVFAGQNNDKDPIFNQVDQAPGNIFRSQTYVYNGYHLGDVNMNARAVFAGQNNDVDPIFNNVDGHPRNIFRSQTFLIREQLATQ